MTIESAQSPPSSVSKHGRLYWFCYHTWHGTKSFAQRHKTRFVILLITILVLLLALRAFVHPVVLWLRIHIFLFTLILPAGLAISWLLRRRAWQLRFGLFVLAAVALVLIAIYDIAPHRYIALYRRYQTLKKVELRSLPITARDRIQPQNSIVSLANESMVETETPAAAHFVRLGDDLRWTIGIEPSYTLRRLMGGVKGIYDIAGNAPSPNFSKESRVPVDFETGEHLLLWHNTRFNVIRAFGPIRYLNYTPGPVKYVRDDKGEWVQIVPLIRWKGWFFPRPEFGGVQVVRQRKYSGSFASAKRILWGIGSWIHPSDVQKHAFLRGQNLLPHEVSRMMAHSFRFQSGFFAPLPGYHLGDIRIPDLPSDVNDPPFVIYLQGGGEIKPMLYHYFGLEPFQEGKQGLNTSLFIPADGSGPVYVYPHHKRQEALAGVSAIAPKVMESKKMYDWTRNRPVEHRPYIRNIGGKTRFFWLTTIVTLKNGEREFIAGTTPDVVLTDAAYKLVTWVDPLHVEQWDQEIEKSMGAAWNK